MCRKPSIAVMLFSISVFLLAPAVYAVPVDGKPVIFANGEKLHGDLGGPGIAAFKGIPFARPPIGELRWRAPVANTPRTGAQDATRFAPACMQTAYMSDWYADVIKAFGTGDAARPNGVSEDCLYLNVWSPLPGDGSTLPVMVWVHGGSNRGGWSYEPNYHGTRLAAKGVVVVSIAYRLGAFGFFSHPALDNGHGQPVANFGILDIQQALKWTRNNIAAFGGDPGNITLFGESAGAGNISDLVAMELEQGHLSHRVILQSSASGLGPRRTLADEQELGLKLANSLGLGDTVTFEQLRNVPAGDLLRVSMEKTGGHYFNAVIDSLTMSNSPFETYQGADLAQLDVLIGTNADEWYMYIAENTTREDIEKAAMQMAPQTTAGLLAETARIAEPRHAMDRLQTAQSMLCPSQYLAGHATERGGRGWMYLFSRQRSGPGGEKLGAYHGTEIPYVFDRHDDWLPVEANDTSLTSAVMDYWVQFARSGDPNLPERLNWPVYNAQNPLVMELGDNIAVAKPRDSRLCQLLDAGKQNKNRTNQ